MSRSANMVVGASGAFLDLMDQVSALAPLTRPVLVIGERGTGKELIAQRLHYLSRRWEAPLVTLNAAAIPETLLESELFGVEPGAFTGAQRRRAGRFEAADGGTLFLDEIATLSLAAQEKLLRVIEYGEIERLGGSDTIEVDVRLVGATNADLPSLARAGTFRADLLDRLAFDVVTVPALRYRREDIPELANHFARRMEVALGRDGVPEIGPEAMAMLIDYPWPGNVRELKNVVERAVYRGRDGVPVAPADIVFDPFDSPYRPAPMPLAGAVPGHGAGATGAVPPASPPGPQAADGPFAPPAPAVPPAPSAPSAPGAGRGDGPALPDPRAPFDLKAAMADIERALVAEAFQRCRHHQGDTAAHLGLSYDQVRHLLKKHALI
ncbi:phage shock protein operon transcriptional activator [Rhodothalassium salexigens]|uniref:phage shock protein operon transcriptional activator n=1 Tax=Rhodothalassium salexigens TaxID=1086 RepID=UPI0019142909|nr:phage shock protein operon transcriptional activator [Rhodothalassium salexigens]MBK5921100.1 phage shock protein operon transcriptional activator [Rhodothalassium salexigens]